MLYLILYMVPFCRPRGPLLWLDPGAFGTLGVGGGFALGATTHLRSRKIIGKKVGKSIITMACPHVGTPMEMALFPMTQEFQDTTIVFSYG